jgi:23S rRNA (pseudouridine1915-N3)-methyltransferase
MIKIISVGKLNQKGISEQIQYYIKQLQMKLEMIEVSDEPTMQGMNVEGERILSKISDEDFVIALAIDGKMMSSEELASFMDEKMTYRSSDLIFIIGGSYGLSQTVLERANLKLSFSKMTFPHQLMRLILIEQIYRGQMILKHHPYHK